MLMCIIVQYLLKCENNKVIMNSQSSTYKICSIYRENICNITKSNIKIFYNYSIFFLQLFTLYINQNIFYLNVAAHRNGTH